MLPRFAGSLGQLRTKPFSLLRASASSSYCAHRDLQTWPHRQYLSRHARGVKRWEERSEKEAEERTDFETLCSNIVENLKVNRYTKASNLTTIYDHCTTVDELNRAEDVLVSFRRSWSRPTPALPLVLVRACLRLGETQRALQYMTDKVQFGVFPSRRVYHIIMDAFITEGDAAGALSAYQQMLEDEVIPDGVTYFLAAKAHVMLDTPEGHQEAISLSRQCFELEPKLGTKSHIVTITSLIEQGHHEQALSVLSHLEKDGRLPPQTHLNLLTHTLVAAGELSKALSLLEQQLCSQGQSTDQQPGQEPGVPGQEPGVPGQSPGVPGQEPGDLDQQPGLPHKAWPQLCSAVQESGDEELLRRLEDLKRELKIRGHLNTDNT